MVPSIAIREGVYQSLQITANHFMEHYHERARFFIYNSGRLHELNSFASDAGINVMVINIQAFNATNRENRRIYEELDQFQSRRPIDVIAATRPILILDEPQKLGGKATVKALPNFNPLMILRYSATHKVRHNLVHRLDALDAYNQKLVKKIAVRGIQVRGRSGTTSYLCLSEVVQRAGPPEAWIELEIKNKSGKIRRLLRRLKCADNLQTVSGGLDAYKGYTISQIDYRTGKVEFTNGKDIEVGQAQGDVTGYDLRRIQIREAIKAHLDTEEKLFLEGIKVLSLFFIDRVAKYRDYDQPDEKGEYARVFEDEYRRQVDEYLNDIANGSKEYRRYLARIDVSRTHNGYFAIDAKTRRLKDPSKSGNAIGDVDAYDLILKDKERLLAFDEPTRFVFSHSALREGWDNPNIFVICMLKNGKSNISRRQEVGRGLRLCVNRDGKRMDDKARVHDINVLTVVTNESYMGFVEGLQDEIVRELHSRPRRATVEYFLGKVLQTESGPVLVDKGMADLIFSYLTYNEYKDDEDYLTPLYHERKRKGTLAALPARLRPYADPIVQLIDSVFSEELLPEILDSRRYQKNNLNDNFHKEAFQKLWHSINRKAVYYVDFDSEELIEKCVKKIDGHLRVSPLQYVVQEGEQNDSVTELQLRDSGGFKSGKTSHEQGQQQPSEVGYDLLGKIAVATTLTRRTAAKILRMISPDCFQQFGYNPEQFLTEVPRIINEQKASIVIEHLVYDALDDRYDADIFAAGQNRQDFSRATRKLKRHVYDHAITDSDVELEFVNALDNGAEVEVYAKLPRGFTIPTPVGNYNPDWAITFKKGDAKHVYFVAETKGSLSSLELRGTEKAKVDCAKKFFDQVVREIGRKRVKYSVVSSYGDLMDIVGEAAGP